MKECWVDIDGFDDYQVSNKGRVRSKDRVIEYSDGRIRRFPSIILKTDPKSNEYLQVHLYVNRKKKAKYVHRLVLESFIGSCPACMECCHENGNKTHNSLTNLRWDTFSNNNLDKRKHGTNGAKRIRRSDGRIFENQLTAAKGSDCTQSLISMALNKKIPTAAGFTWGFV